MLILLVFTVILANYIFIEGPSDTLKHNSYLDTGERLSARIVDMHMLAPESGRIVMRVDVPREIAGNGYDIRVSPAIDDSGTGQYLVSHVAGAILGLTGATESPVGTEIPVDVA